MFRSLFGRREPAPPERPDPRIPDGLRVYAIGDVHGRADLLDRMAGLIAQDMAASDRCHAYTVCLGDYVDRGLQSSSVLERLSSGQFPTSLVPLLGNHEATLLSFLEDANVLSSWRAFGGLETLFSYGVRVDNIATQDPGRIRREFLGQLPAAHRDFLAALETHHRVGDYFFCHAGVRPGIPLDRQQRDDLLWIREPFLESPADHGAVVVHGHTPVEQPVLRRNRIGIDTGAYATGRLTCLRLERDMVGFITAET